MHKYTAASTVGDTKHIDEDGENLIKAAFQNSDRQPTNEVENLSIDRNNTSIDEPDNLSTDNSKTSIDKTDKPSIDTDNQLPTTNMQPIITVLKDTISTLQNQLNTKDTQIEHLQSELLNERQHNREQSDRLAVLADQAQKLQLAQLSRDNHQIEGKENTHKTHWWNKRKGVRNNGRKKNVCEVNN